METRVSDRILLPLILGMVLANASPAGAQTPPAKPASKNFFTDCQAVADTDPNAIVRVLEKAQKKDELKEENEFALIRYYCKLTDASEVAEARVNPQTNLSSLLCSGSKNPCVIAHSVPETLLLRKGQANDQIHLLFRHSSKREIKVVGKSDFTLAFKSAEPENSQWVSTGSLFEGLAVGVTLPRKGKATECQVSVSGAKEGIPPDATCKGPGCAPAKAAVVENGKLIFQAAIIGASGDLAIPKSVEWSGGPGASGIWESAPVGSDVVVWAKVTTADDSTAHCGVKFSQLGKGFNLRVNKYGDCPYFRALRDYYYLNPANTAVQTAPFNPPLTLPGFDVSYGSDYPDIPFRGILNVAADASGEVKVVNNELVIPPIDNRRFTAAVVVGKLLDPRTNQVGNAVYFGELDPRDYSNTTLRLLTSEPADDKYIVFQFYLAAKEMAGGADKRGRGGTPLWELKEGINGRPHDRLVPVVNESCMPVFQIRAPERKDKTMPAVVADAITCAFSRPYKVADIRAGRISVSVTHFTAEAPNHLFPLDLIKGKEPVVEEVDITIGGGPSPTPRQCWKIYPSFNTGDISWSTGGSSSTTTAREQVLERNPGDECSMKLTITNTTTHNNTGSTVGYRWNMAAMGWGYRFAKKVKAMNDPAAGTILKWNPKPGTHAMVESFTGGGNDTTSVLTTEGSVSDKTFSVRMWGHQVADIVNDESGEGEDMSGYGGNTVAAFKVPVCPGSQFNYDNISLSWSPLILDLAGRGIRISRRFEKSVPFDIKGNKYQAFVDWPENTSEVAFLVLPDKRGRVESIRELFGDDAFKNGFEKLAHYDTDKDGRISPKDKVFGQLRLWFDRDRDGKVGKGELETLAKHGVAFISTQYMRPGLDMSAEQRTLSGLYYNEKAKSFRNIEDHYFYEYIDSKRVKLELRNARLPAKKGP